LTVLVRIAAKHGMKKLIDALGGDLGFGDVASELFSELAASERLLGERLAGIERRLDEVLEQPYRSAIGTGLRTLLDAGTTSDGQVRAEELVRATALFREASAAARSSLQVAVAERYLVLCAIALGRRDTACTALGRLDHAALTALTQADHHGRFQFASRDAADQAAQELGRIRRRRALEERTTQLVLRVQRGATDAGELSVQLLREAAVLAHGLNLTAAPPPELRWLPPRELLEEPAVEVAWMQPPRHPTEDIGRIEVRATGRGPLRVGPLSVEWHHVGLHEGPRQRRSEAEKTAREYLTRHNPTSRADLGAGPGAGAGAGAGAGVSTAGPPPDPLVHLIEVDLTVRADPPFAEHVDFFLTEPDPPGEFGEFYINSDRLIAGEYESRVRRLIMTAEPKPACTLRVGGLFVFPSP
jgi:hypothetical protein